MKIYHYSEMTQSFVIKAGGYKDYRKHIISIEASCILEADELFFQKTGIKAHKASISVEIE